MTSLSIGENATNDAQPRCEAHKLQCLEVWGGNQQVQSGVSVPGLDGWISSNPVGAADRGGDIHYVSLCGGGRISRFTVADVAGHGSDAAAMAERLRLLMRKYVNTVDQTRLARALNLEFGRLAESERFATALLATYFAPTDHLIVCNAGHPRPLWYSLATDTWQFLDHHVPQLADSVRNLPLGVIHPTDYYQFAVELGRGDQVVMYTDSLIEARDSQGSTIGEAGLLDIARSIGPAEPEEFARRITDEVATFRGGRAELDDQTVLVLHHNADDPPRQSMGEMVKVMARMVGLIGS